LSKSDLKAQATKLKKGESSEEVKLPQKKEPKSVKKEESSSEEIKKPTKKKSSEDIEKDMANMTTDEGIKYLNKINPKWKNFLEKDDDPRDHVRQMIKDAKAAKKREVKREASPVRGDFASMSTSQAIKYLNDTNPIWKELLEEDEDPKDHVRQLISDAKKKVRAPSGPRTPP
jgi:hypothetical protein